MGKIKIYAFSDEASASIDDQIKALVRNGLDGMEIRGVDGTNISSITIEKAKEVKAKLEDSGLCVWSIGSPIGKIDIREDFNSHLELFKHTLEIAKILDAKNIRLFSFFTPKDHSPNIYKNQVMDRLGRFEETAKNYKVTLCHENEKGIYGDVAERCLEIHRHFPEIKGVFDPANFVQCGVDTLEAWKLLRGYIRYLHIKDATLDGFVVPSGKGAANIKGIVKDSIKLGKKHFTIEPHLTVFCGLENLEKDSKTIMPPYSFPDSNTAFDTACKCFKDLIGG